MRKRIAQMLIIALLLNICTLAESMASIEGTQPTREWYDAVDCSILTGKKICITVQSMKNAYWIGVMAALKDVLKSYGADCRIVSCNDNAAVQLEQIEGFILGGCDIIMVHPSDASALEEICARARGEGIQVMCWDDPMENTDVNWILNNHDLGLEIGRMAGSFINRHYSEQTKADVIVIGYPQTKVLLERANGIVEGLVETAAGKFEIVDSLSALTFPDALKAVETAIGIYPNAKVVVGIGAGPMLGADEAMSIAYSGRILDDMGVFTADVTSLQLEHLEDPSYPARGVVGYEGSDMDTARCCASMMARLLCDEIGARNVYRPILPITGDFSENIRDGMK